MLFLKKEADPVTQQRHFPSAWHGKPDTVLHSCGNAEVTATLTGLKVAVVGPMCPQHTSLVPANTGWTMGGHPALLPVTAAVLGGGVY